MCLWCALIVHRNINHSICLVCISESVSLLPPPKKKNNCRSTAAGIYRQYAAYSKCSCSNSRAEKVDRRAGVGTTACADHRELAEKKLPSFQYLVFSKLLLVKTDAARNLLALCPNVSISFRFVYYHLGSYYYLCLPTSLTVPELFVCKLALAYSVQYVFVFLFKLWPTCGSCAQMSTKCWHYYIFYYVFGSLLSKYQKDI